MELYCIKTDSQQRVIKGNIYPLLEIRDKTDCSCSLVNVGILKPSTKGKIINCLSCGKRRKKLGDGYTWINKSYFANIDDINIEEAIVAITNSIIDLENQISAN